MSKKLSHISRYILILTIIIIISEYMVMILFDSCDIEEILSKELEAIADALLLIVFSSAPIYFWIIKPIIKSSQKYQDELENLVSALEGAGEAVIITNPAGTITYVNQTFTTMTGYSPEEAIGNNPRMLQSGKQSKAFYKMMWRSIVETGEWQGEVWNKRKSGEIFPERLHIKSIKNKNGDVKFYIANTSDITKQHEQQRILLQAQKMEAIGSLVGGVAHNFNNMLAAIIGKTYLAKKIADNFKMIQHLQSIEDVSNEAALIIKQLLSFSHDSMQQKQPIPIVELLKNAVETARMGIAEDIEITTHFTAESLTVYCDPVEIKQVMVNLLNNARDALETSGEKRISITIERKPWEGCPRNDTCGVCNAEVMHLIVEDSGSGINETDLDHIFDPFFTTKEVGKGTGLGLSMAKGAIESHGGAFNVSSEEGVGTTFEICLPLINIPLIEKEEDQQPVNAKSNETILIIDDEAMVLTTLKQLLQSLGYNVLTARDGQEGVQVFLEHADRISLVITDAVMPVMDGLSAIAKMRETKPHQPVIFITGYDTKQLNHDEQTLIVSKPFNIVDLSYKIYALLYPDIK